VIIKDGIRPWQKKKKYRKRAPAKVRLPGLRRCSAESPTRDAEKGWDGVAKSTGFSQERGVPEEVSLRSLNDPRSWEAHISGKKIRPCSRDR